MFRVSHAVWLVLWHYIFCIVGGEQYIVGSLGSPDALSCLVSCRFQRRAFWVSQTFDALWLEHVFLQQDASCKSLDESARRVYCTYRGVQVTPSDLPNGGLRAFACLSSDRPKDSDLIIYDRNFEPLIARLHCVSELDSGNKYHPSEDL